MTQTWWLERKIRNLGRKFLKANFAYTILKYSDLECEGEHQSEAFLCFQNSFLLEYHCFLMFCYFLLGSKMNQRYIYIYPLSLLDFLPIQVATVHSGEFPVLYNMFLLVIYFIHIVSSVYMLIPVSQLLPSPCPLGFPCGSAEKNSPTVQELQEMWILSLVRICRRSEFVLIMQER